MPKQPLPKDKKRIYVIMGEKQHLDLKIKLDHLRIGLSEFIRACSEALIEEHPIMEDFIEHYRENSEKHSKRIAKLAKKDRKQSEKIAKDLGLDLDEIEDIFDIIEQDHPEIQVLEALLEQRTYLRGKKRFLKNIKET